MTNRGYDICACGRTKTGFTTLFCPVCDVVTPPVSATTKKWYTWIDLADYVPGTGDITDLPDDVDGYAPVVGDIIDRGYAAYITHSPCYLPDRPTYQYWEIDLCGELGPKPRPRYQYWFAPIRLLKILNR